MDRDFHNQLISWLQFHEAMLIGELVPEALRYLRNNPACTDLSAFDHVIVDEYQDLNKAEQVLLDLLSASGNSAVVGDEDQSIYSFRHAHPEGIVEYAATHAGTHDESLLECRRCGTRIVEIANHLIRINHASGATPRLQPFSGNPEGEVHIVQWRSTEQQSEGLASYVAHLVNDRGYEPGEILILCPRRLIGYGIRDELRARQIPTHSFYHEESLEDNEAQIAFTILTLLANRQDRVSLRFWLGHGSPSWRKGEYARLRAHCEESGASPWDALGRIDAGTLSLDRVAKIVARFRVLKSRLLALEGLVGRALVDALFPENLSGAKVLREAALLKSGADTPASKLFDALRTLTQPEMPESGDFVRVMSLHKSKGLTSKVVIVAGCIEGLIPTVIRDGATIQQREADLKEQRRLFYVAITRGQEILVMSSVTRLPLDLAHKIGALVGGSGATISSRFLGELGPTAPSAKSGPQWQSAGYV